MPSDVARLAASGSAARLCQAFAALFVACTLASARALAPPAPAASAPKVLRYAFRVAETSFDPAALSDLYSRSVTGHIFEGLYGYDPLARPALIRPLTAAALPHLPEGSGTVINTTSMTACRGSPTLLDYSATKGAIVSFTRSLADNLAKKKVRVNAVAPGPVWTPLIPSTFDAEKVARFGSDVPLERAAQPEEIAPSYVFLASDDASYMTGPVLARADPRRLTSPISTKDTGWRHRCGACWCARSGTHLASSTCRRRPKCVRRDDGLVSSSVGAS